jgi:two-component system, NtrC family, sensor kinase
MGLAVARTEIEGLFETLAEKSPVGVYIVQDGKFCYANPAFQSCIGYRENELVGMDSLEFVFPEDREMVKENAIKMLKGEVTSAYQFRVIHKTGSIRWVMESVSSIQYGGRRATLGNYMDITERKEIEETLQAERNKLQSLIDAMEYSLTIQDTEFNIIYQNQQSSIASDGDHMGEKCYRAYEGRDKVCDGCPAAEAFKDGQSHTVERRTVISGKVAFWENTANPIRDAEGKIVACLELTRDVTKRKEMEAKLRESEQRYRLLFESSPDCIAQIDEEGRYLTANPAMSQSLGMPLEELIGKTLFEVMPQEVAQRRLEIIGKALHERQSQTFEDEREERQFYNMIVPTEIPGQSKAVQVIARDITERKEAEQALADEATRRRILVDHSRDGIVVLDENGKVYEANRRFGDMLGYSPEEVRELRVWDWDTQWPREQLLEMVRSVDEAGDQFETYHRRKDGTTYDVEISTNGAIVAGQKLVFCVCRDITERKRAQEQYELLAEHSADIIYRFNVKDERYIYVSPAVERILGYTDQEALALRPADVLTPESYEKQKHEMLKDFENGIPHRTLQLEAFHKDGHVIPVEVNAQLVNDKEGQPLEIIGVVRDISERKKMQEQLMLSDRLASIGQLVSGIAHELNNPLTGVIGFSDLLLTRDLPADVKDDLEIVNREARRTSTIVRGLLTFAHQQGTEKALVDINSVIGEVLRLRSYDQRVNNVEVDARFATGLPQVLGSGAQLQQAFINIIINAEQAMLEARGKGRLTVATKQVGEVVRASITDDGPGISPENMKKLFSPFFTTKEVGKGTGLGLSICHGIVTEHGGKVYAESEPGKGATFVVELPVSKQSEKRCIC